MFNSWTKRPNKTNAGSAPVHDPFVPASVAVPPSALSTGGASGAVGVNGIANPAQSAFGAPINPNSAEGPSILGKFVRFLQTKAINSENLFITDSELDAEVQVVKKNILREIATYGGDNDALQLSSYTKNPQVIAELLKHYLASLPEPLLTFQLYDSFLLTQTIQAPPDRVWAYRFLLAYLPPGFRGSVKILLTLLFNLSRNSEINRMDANALAAVFGPFFLRPEEELYYMRDDSTLITQIVALLIQEYESVLRAAPTGAIRATIGPQPSISSFLAAAHSHPDTSAPQSHLPLSPHPLDSSAQHSELRAGNPLSRSGTALPDHPLSVRLPDHPLARSNPDSPVTHPRPPRPTSQLPARPTQPSSPRQSPQSPPAPPPSQLTQATTQLNSHPPTQSSAHPPTPGHGQDGAEEAVDKGDLETVTKLKKLRESVLVLLDDQITPSIMALLSAINQSTTPAEAVEVSKALRDAKKVLSEHMQQSLKADKPMVATYLGMNPKPALTMSATAPSDDGKLNDLRVAAFSATDQFTDLVHFLRTKMASMSQSSDLPETIAIAQIAKILKSNLVEQLQRLQVNAPLSPRSGIPISPLIFPSTPSIPSSTPSTPSTPSGFSASSPLGPPPALSGRPALHIPLSPPQGRVASAPSTLSGAQGAGLSAQGKAASVRPLALSRDTCVTSIDSESVIVKQQLQTMLAVVPTCAQGELVEFAKGIRFVKQIVSEKATELSLGIEQDIRVEAMDGEDQLSALRRALAANITKIIETTDGLVAHIHSSGGQFMDPRPVADAFSVVSRALANTHPSLAI